MALVACTYCSAPISDTAVKCPNCGAVPSLKRSTEQKTCIECGANNNSSDLNCKRCGYDFTQTVVLKNVNGKPQTIIQNNITQKNNNSGCATAVIIIIIVVLIVLAIANTQ